MKVQIRKVRAEGMELDEKFSAEWTGLTPDDSICFTGPVGVSARIFRAEDELIARIEAKSAYRSVCGRCLEEVNRPWHRTFQLIFDIGKRTEFITLDEDIRQEILLNLPARTLCREDCKGLCVECGANLNEKECEHKHSIVKA